PTSSFGFDAPQDCVRMRRANDRRKRLPGELEVISEATGSRKQSMVFTPPRRATDTGILHGDAPRASNGSDVHHELPKARWCLQMRVPSGNRESIALQVAEIPLRDRNSGNASLAWALRITCVV